MLIPQKHPVYKALNKPITIWGVERRLFFLATIMGVLTFDWFSSLRAGILMFGLLYILARWATVTDPQILRILLNASQWKVQYDPAKRLKEVS